MLNLKTFHLEDIISVSRPSRMLYFPIYSIGLFDVVKNGMVSSREIVRSLENWFLGRGKFNSILYILKCNENHLNVLKGFETFSFSFLFLFFLLVSKAVMAEKYATILLSAVRHSSSCFLLANISQALLHSALTAHACYFLGICDTIRAFLRRKRKNIVKNGYYYYYLLNQFSRWCNWTGMIIRIDKCHSFGMEKKLTTVNGIL